MSSDFCEIIVSGGRCFLAPKSGVAGLQDRDFEAECTRHGWPIGSKIP